MTVKIAAAISPVNKQIQESIEWLSVIYELIADSIFDAITTLAAFATVIAICAQAWPSMLPWTIFTAGGIYACLFLLRLVRKFRNQATTDQLYEKLAEIREDVNERLDSICRNIV